MIIPAEDPRGRVAIADDAWAFNARVGVVLFFIYLALFLGFVALAAFGQDVLAMHLALVDAKDGVWSCFGGVNLAILYGFLLIIAAFVLAVLYMLLCQPEPEAAAMPQFNEEQIAEIADSEEGSA